MGMLRRLTAAAVVALCLLLPGSPAFASGKDVIIDCNDNGHLTKEYSQKEYRDALDQMPADVRQYTDCENIIRRAQRGLPIDSGGTANSGNPFGDATPEEIAKAQAEIEVAKKSGGNPQRIAGDVVYPGHLSFTKASAAASELPTPLLVLIALILAGAVAFAVSTIRTARRRGDHSA